MELRPLGRSGVRVSALCLGTMTFGNEADEATGIELVHRYLDAGGNFVDCADVYNGGRSEEIVGRALEGRRDRVVLATKGRLPTSDDPNDQGASRRHLSRAVEASLRRFGTDWIDLYQIHWPDPTVAPEETLSTLDGLVRAGKIRYVGVSNYLGSQLQRAFDLCDRHGWSPVVSHQPQYSLIHREIELETLPLCAANDVAVLPWSPLGGGLLTGKYRGGGQPGDDTRLGAQPLWGRDLNERNLAIAEAVAAIAEETGHTPAQVALNWVLHRPGVTAPIVGARNHEQLQDNLGAEGWKLEADHAAALVRASRYSLPHPHDMYRGMGLRRYD
jgi:aryl-alcohol dehydrogenase-like predicted oxidoreductase